MVNHLKKHMQSHSVENHTCPYCHAYFKKTFNLRQHIKKHENVKYECSQCSRAFTDRSTLNSHIKAQHEKRNHIECEVCGKTFYHRIHYKEHTRLHTKEKPFECEVCGKKFSWHDSVKKHMQTHSTEARYKCRLCGKWFRWLQGVRQHLQCQHRLKKLDVASHILLGTSEEHTDTSSQLELTQLVDDPTGTVGDQMAAFSVPTSDECQQPQDSPLKEDLPNLCWNIPTITETNVT